MSNTNSDEIPVCQNVTPHSPKDNVQSHAIIKSVAVEAPLGFIRLQTNTNLNHPPANWLANSAGTSELYRSLYGSSDFASFHIAQMFPDCVGEVDLVSDAENLKKLLKVAYAPKCLISMVVHKVGSSFLIDEFDFQKYLLLQANEDWKWIQTFFIETLLSSISEQDMHFCLNDKRRPALQRKNLLSKFLYHSLQTNPKIKAASRTSSSVRINKTKFSLLEPLLPEPNLKENIPGAKSDGVFNRNVVWTFDCFRMLVGTNMPIFRGDTRPCFSLRLHEATKPINAFTAIDYWLDNLICNVPEVVMCYHLDGILQKYELIKTEDLPYLENATFPSHLFPIVTQNILSFLNQYATKTGHTYWLFKGTYDNYLHLYDLTKVVMNNPNGDGNTKDNPFAVPIAMLLYNSARNMKYSSGKISARKAESIRTLLDNCINLLPKEKYPQIVTSSHYILSDLHIPVNIDSKLPNFDKNYSDSHPDNDSNSSSENGWNFRNDIYKTAIVVKNICGTLRGFNNKGKGKKNTSLSPMAAYIMDHCRIALQHICDGTSCLQYFEWNTERKDIILEVKPFQPIPVPYKTLRPKVKRPTYKGWNNKTSKDKTQQGRKVKETNFESKLTHPDAARAVISSWNDQLKFNLFEKASLIYATLAEQNFHLENYGQSLRYIYMNFRCQKIVLKYSGSTEFLAATRSTLLVRAGDCFFQISQNWDSIDKYLEEFGKNNELDEKILIELQKDFDKATWDCFPPPIKNYVQVLVTSCRCYDAALENADVDAHIKIMKKKGNVRNELGIKYMFWAQDEYSMYIKEDKSADNKPEDVKSSETIKEPLYQTLAKQSCEHLICGIGAFEEIQDNENLSHLLCNMGRVMRFRAHIPMQDDDSDVIRLQGNFYNQSFSCYERALGILGSRKKNPELWDAIKQEILTITFSFAKQVQDYLASDLATEETKGESVELLRKFLNLCDFRHSRSKQVLHQSGLIHSRLASFYNSQVCKAQGTQTITTSLPLCRFHYKEASKMFERIKEYKEYFDIQVHKIALQIHQVEVSSDTIIKMKGLQKALNVCLESKPMLDFVKKSSANVRTEDLNTILKLFENRIQYILRTLANIRPMEKCGQNRNIYKRMYSAFLNIKMISDEGFLAAHLSNILERINEIQ